MNGCLCDTWSLSQRDSVYWSIAQLVEQLAVNQQVAGSIPPLPQKGVSGLRGPGLSSGNEQKMQKVRVHCKYGYGGKPDVASEQQRPSVMSRPTRTAQY